MRLMLSACLVIVIGLGAVGVGGANEPQRDVVVYVEKPEYPVIDELVEANEALVEVAKAKTDEILAAYEEAQKMRTEPVQKLRFDMDGIVKPEDPAAFSTRVWHFPPTPQYLTGACWSFSATSYMESEIHRLHGEDIKLSEMWTAYWEFVAKARGFVASRGESLVDHGSQSGAMLRVFAQQGVVPREAYEGAIGDDLRFNHDLMLEKVNSFLGWCKASNFWDGEAIVAMVRRMLDATMGRPPGAVLWNGAELSPQAFLAEVCRIDPADYVSVMSTLSQPMWARGEYAVPDNWWHGADTVNVPLDIWYGIVLDSIKDGRSLVIGGDVSEPGLNGFEDMAVIPSFDIPSESIDQSSREFRFDNGTTTDDHGIHLVGHTRLHGHDWFLIKDSNRSSRQGQFKGYYFYRDDFVRLKMLTITVHRDQIEDILAKVDTAN
jgi:bleomycin hydrolase